MSALDALVFRTRAAAFDPEQALVVFHGRGADDHDLYPLLTASSLIWSRHRRRSRLDTVPTTL